MELATEVLKWSLVAGLVSIAVYVFDYTRLAPWWKDRLGLTIVVEALLLIGIELPLALSAFGLFNHISTVVATWVLVVCIALVCPVMLWRTVVWELEAWQGRRETARRMP